MIPALNGNLMDKCGFTERRMLQKTLTKLTEHLEKERIDILQFIKSKSGVKSSRDSGPPAIYRWFREMEAVDKELLSDEQFQTCLMIEISKKLIKRFEEGEGDDKENTKQGS